MPAFRLGSLVGLLVIFSIFCPAAVFGLISDDFNQPNVDSAWTFINPRGDGSVRIEGSGTGDARVLISVPAGVEHDIWTDGVFAPHLMQPCADDDFVVEAKFVSGVKSKYQTQGILVALADGVLRFELFGDGTGTRLYAAEIRNGSATTRAYQSVAGTPPLFLRVERNGDQWRLLFSPNGLSWAPGVDFTAAATVTAIGLYAGNSGTYPPAHTAAIDYFFDLAAPVTPEDGTEGIDDQPPRISGIAATPRTDRATIVWETDEPANGEVDYGLPGGVLLGTISLNAVASSQTVELLGLQADTDYWFRIFAWDAARNVTITDDFPFRTATPGACRIDFWQGTVQAFGRPGVPQRWVNILGDVAECPDIASLSYRLNGGTEQPLSIGADDRRLVSPGDFNIDIDSASLTVGTNTVEVIGRDAYGQATSETVQVEWQPEVWPLPYVVDWATVDPPQEAVQIVDGRWAIENNRLHPTVLGYDRIINFGDMKWRDYEVTVPITIQAVDPAGFNPVSNAPGVGVQLRWNGHTTMYSYEKQPLIGWLPVGATAWYGFGSKKFKLLLNGRTTAEDTSGLQMQIGTTYIFKVRVETLATGEPRYGFKFWDSRQSEPVSWNLTGTGLTSDPTAGSALVVAHHVDAHLGEISVVPIGAADTTAPVIGSIAVSAQATGGTVSWTTGEAAKGALAYGLTSACADGRLEETAFTTAHAVTLSGLKSDTLYYYRIEASDAAGNLATASTRSFRTLESSSDPARPVSDEFNDSTLNTGLWSLVNPLGDATVAVSGGKASITVPAGREHDLWTAGNFAPRLLQPAPTGDFEVAAKFDSAVRSRYQMQGIIVEAEPGTFLRCEIMGDGTASRLFVAAVRSGSASIKANRVIAIGAPNYLRVKRTGDSWAVSWSADGITWTAGVTFTQTLAATSVGLYAGNSGSNPAHTLLIDWFRNPAVPAPPADTAAPDIGGIAASAQTAGGTVSWTTDEAAKGALAYGLTSACADGRLEETAYATFHAVTLSGLKSDTLYYYRIEAGDAAGNLATSETRSFRTLASSADPARPVPDEFDDSTLNTGLWSFVNPIGDVTVAVSGGKASITVPAGREHDLWTAGNFAPRLLQPAPAGDFEVAAKFDSAVRSRYQMQGIIVEAEPGTFLRCEIMGDGTASRLFVAAVRSGSASIKANRVIAVGAPNYLRVKRTGDSWAVSWSADGSTWTAGVTFTQALAATSVGFYAGNAGGNPAHTLLIDWFRRIGS